jgi:hypothetical protein
MSTMQNTTANEPRRKGNTALRDAMLTHPTLVEALIPLFSSTAAVHNVADGRRTIASA